MTIDEVCLPQYIIQNQSESPKTRQSFAKLFINAIHFHFFLVLLQGSEYKEGMKFVFWIFALNVLVQEMLWLGTILNCV